MFRLVLECLTNIHCHSAAKNAVIRIERANDTLAVEVSDDGKGMSAEKLIEVQSAGSGVGIGACASGCANCGDMKIESSEAGTRIVVTLPIINARLSTRAKHLVPRDGIAERRTQENIRWEVSQGAYAREANQSRETIRGPRHPAMGVIAGRNHGGNREGPSSMP